MIRGALHSAVRAVNSAVLLALAPLCELERYLRDPEHYRKHKALKQQHAQWRAQPRGGGGMPGFPGGPNCTSSHK